MAVKLFRFLSILLAAICLIPAGAHLFELPGKIRLEPDAHLTVQQIYRGWALFGIPIFGAKVSAMVLVWLSRSRPPPCGWCSAAGC